MITSLITTRFISVFILMYVLYGCGLKDKTQSVNLSIDEELQMIQNKNLESRTPNTYRSITDVQIAFRHVANIALPAVVEIKAEFQSLPNKKNNSSLDFFFYSPFSPDLPNQEHAQNRQKRQNEPFSGFIIHPKGYVLTNYQSIKNSKTIQVILPDGNKYKAIPIGFDSTMDLALLKINGSHDFPYLALPKKTNMQQGDFILAISSPFGFSGTITFGVISALNRIHTLINSKVPFKNLMQLDASLTYFNIGGPILNIYGEVIGISTKLSSKDKAPNYSIGFAIPVDNIKQSIRTIINKSNI